MFMVGNDGIAQSAVPASHERRHVKFRPAFAGCSASGGRGSGKDSRPQSLRHTVHSFMPQAASIKPCAAADRRRHLCTPL